MEIRCCCTPEKLLGYAPQGANLPIRTVLVDNGTEYEAYSADELPLSVLQTIEGYQAAHKHGTGGRSWKGKSKSSKKTWKEEKKKKRTWK